MTPAEAAAELSQLGQEMERDLARATVALFETEPEIYPVVYSLHREELDLRTRGKSIGRGRVLRTELSQDAWGCLLDAARILAAGGSPVVLDAQAELTTQQAADLLGMSRPTLLLRLAEGRIPYRWEGTHRRLKVADVIRYRDERRRTSSAALDRLVADERELDLPD